MEPHVVTGTYTYRSFINEPHVVGDFNQLQFAEAAWTLFSGLATLASLTLGALGNLLEVPKYDYLGEFYSSHVNPLFWRLHGWSTIASMTSH